MYFCGHMTCQLTPCSGTCMVCPCFMSEEEFAPEMPHVEIINVHGNIICCANSIFVFSSVGVIVVFYTVLHNISVSTHSRLLFNY